MQQIISFLYKNKYVLLFLLLEGFAILFTIESHSYHKSKFINSSNFITGGIYNKINNFKEFLLLKDENKRLSEENVRLQNLLNLQLREGLIKDSLKIDTVLYYQKYRFTPAKVINNDYRKNNNYLTINKGSKDGIKPDLGVINSLGIIGITKNVSSRYTTVLSILNVNSRINVKLKKSDHFGSLFWNNNDSNTVQLIDLPIQANIAVGDTIITGGKSTIFPEGIPVGTVKAFNTVNNKYEFIDISLFNDMSSVGYVEVITNFDKAEIKSLEERTVNE